MTLLLDTVTRAGERTNAGTRRRNGAGSLFGENGRKKDNGGSAATVTAETALSWTMAIPVPVRR